MKFTALKCPNCNAPLDNSEELDVLYCKYCGHRIVVEDLTDSELNAAYRVRRMKHKERMQDKEYDEKHNSWMRNEKTKHIHFVRNFVAVACLALLFIGIFGFLHLQSSMEEKNLQRTVDSIMQDIDNGDYSSARIKAESLYYTSDWSDDIKEKWDETREQLIKEIDKAEKESKIDSGHSILGLFGGSDEEVKPKAESEIHGFTNMP